MPLEIITIYGKRRRVRHGHGTTGTRTSPTFRIHEVNDVLFLEDVNFFDAWDCVNAQTLQRALQSLVVCGGRLVHGLFLSVGARGDRGKNTVEGQVQKRRLRTPAWILSHCKRAANAVKCVEHYEKSQHLHVHAFPTQFSSVKVWKSCSSHTS